MGIMFGWEPLLPVLLALDDVGLLVFVAPPAAGADPPADPGAAPVAPPFW